MDAHPTVVLNDAVRATVKGVSEAGSAMASALVEQLTNEPHYAEFEIRVTGRIINPETGAVIAEVDRPERYEIFWDRNPDRRDQTE